MRGNDVCLPNTILENSLELTLPTVKSLNIGTPRTATAVVLNIKPFNFTMK